MDWISSELAVPAVIAAAVFVAVWWFAPRGSAGAAPDGGRPSIFFLLSFNFFHGDNDGAGGDGGDGGD